MKLTTKGRYAVTAMIALAVGQQAGRVSLKSVAEKQRISLSYLEQLFAKLRHAGLVEGTRGPGGGYRLAHKPASISVADIILAVDESLDITECKGKEDCLAGGRCLSHSVWQTLSSKLYVFLSQVNLEELMQNTMRELSESDRSDQCLANVGVAFGLDNKQHQRI